ncbi:zinc finger protein 644a [Aplochiton taeniatus]
MSCLAGIEDEDKDADSEMNPFSFLQESSKMSQDPVSYIDSLGGRTSYPVKQHSSVLDVLSNAEMLSTVGLGNGPSSHRAMETEEFHSLSTEREEEKSITQLKTVQEIDTAGIWGFDVDSPDNSLDKFGSSNDLGWDPRREFMQFLWENHDDSPGEEPEEVPPNNNQRRRKRKMDMVVMVDPSEELYPDLSLKSPEVSDEDGEADPIPVNKVRNLRKNSNSQSPPTELYPISQWNC